MNGKKRIARQHNLLLEHSTYSSNRKFILDCMLQLSDTQEVRMICCNEHYKDKLREMHYIISTTGWSHTYAGKWVTHFFNNTFHGSFEPGWDFTRTTTPDADHSKGPSRGTRGIFLSLCLSFSLHYRIVSNVLYK